MANDANQAQQLLLPGVTMVRALETRIKDFLGALPQCYQPDADSIDKWVAWLVTFDYELRPVKLVRRIKAMALSKFDKYEVMKAIESGAIDMSAIYLTGAMDTDALDEGVLMRYFLRRWNFELEADEAVSFLVMCYLAQRGNRSKFLEDHPGAAEVNVTYWAKDLAELEREHAWRLPLDEPLTKQWERNLQWGATMLESVDEFGEAIFYTMPWERLVSITMKSNNAHDISKLDQCAVR